MARNGNQGWILGLAAALALGWAGSAGAADAFGNDELADLSLDQLMGITVTSASKKAQNADEVASAIFVLTQEDIRRSGATSIPEVLRLVPGVSVARSNGSSWAVTARGFNGRFASKLLVMIDGRSVYTPLFSGVYWDVQDTLLEDIERIEVIRGPGATVWGANAVNGVINIITKDAEDTQGLLSTASVGNQDQAIGGARWGGRVGDDLHYRVFAKYVNRDDQQTLTGGKANDGMEVARLGFRSDWDASDADQVTLQGDFYDGDSGQLFVGGLDNISGLTFTNTDGDEVQGGNVLARWSHTFSETMDASVQLYYDRTERYSPLVGEERDTLDVEFQHRFALPFNQEVIWGGGYRYTQDDIRNSFASSLIPDERHDDTFSFFAQDEIRFWNEKARLTFGTKVENNDYTGWEFQPSVRMAVLPHEDHTLWASASRAVRTPSRADHNLVLNSAVIPAIPSGFGIPHPLLGVSCDLYAPGGCPATLIGARGDDTKASERMYSFEVGYRARLLEKVTLDVAAFYSDYNSLTSVDNGPSTLGTPGLPLWTITQLLGDSLKATTRGVEVDLRADVLDWWRVIVGYTYHHNRTDLTTPSHSGVLRSQMDLPFDLELDATLYLVGNLSSTGSSISDAGRVPSYERLDLRVGWRPRENLELSLVGQNLTDAKHPEFLNEIGFPSSLVQRAYYGKVTFDY